jgi:putative membrane protein
MVNAAASVMSGDERARVGAAIKDAEKGTAGEIFVVVARTSDDYRFIALLWATLAALPVPLPLLFLTEMPASEIYFVQLAVFAVIAIVLSLPGIRPLVVPGAIKIRQAHRLAMEQFLAHGLHMTEARTGVLIFVSLAERYAEVVADAGIARTVEQRAWDDLIARLLSQIRADKLADGLVEAVEAAGGILAKHFPVRPGDRDELANDLVLI